MVTKEVKIKISAVAKGMAAITKTGKKIQKLGNQTKRSFGKGNKEIKKTSKNVQGMNTFLSQSGNRLGFVAFQFVFMAGTASRAMQQIRQGFQETIEKGSEALDEITRAIAQSGLNITASTAGSIKAMELLNDGIRTLGGGKTIFSIKEVAEATKEIGRAFTFTGTEMAIAAQVMTTTKAALRLMTIEQIGAEEAAIQLAKIMKQFSLSASEATDAVNTLVIVNQASSVTLDDLSASIAAAGNVAREFGVDLDTLAGIMGVISDRIGIKGSATGRAFRRILDQLARTTTSLNPQLRQLGIIIRDDAGQLNNIVDILSDFNDALKRGGQAGSLVRQIILELGTDSIRARDALLALTQGFDDLQLILQKIEEGETLAARLEEIFTGTAQAQMKRLKNALDSLRVDFTAGFTPALQDAAAALRALTTTVEVQEFFLQWGKILAEEVGPVIKQIAALTKDLIKTFVKADNVARALSKAFITLVATLILLTVVGTVGAVTFLFISILQRLGLTALFTNVTLLGMIGTFLLFAAVAGVAFILFRELLKGAEDMSVPLVALTIAFLALGTAIAFAMFGIPGLIAALAVIGVVGALLIGKELIDSGALENAEDAILGIGDTILDTLESMKDDWIKAGEVIVNWIGDGFIQAADFQTWITDAWNKNIDELIRFFEEEGKALGKAIKVGIIAALTGPTGLALAIAVDPTLGPVDEKDQADKDTGKIIGETIFSAIFPFGGLLVQALDKAFEAGGELLKSDLLAGFAAFALGGLQPALAASTQVLDVDDEQLQEVIDQLEAIKKATDLREREGFPTQEMPPITVDFITQLEDFTLTDALKDTDFGTVLAANLASSLGEPGLETAGVFLQLNSILANLSDAELALVDITREQVNASLESVAALLNLPPALVAEFIATEDIVEKSNQLAQVLLLQLDAQQQVINAANTLANDEIQLANINREAEFEISEMAKDANSLAASMGLLEQAIFDTTPLITDSATVIKNAGDIITDESTIVGEALSAEAEAIKSITEKKKEISELQARMAIEAAKAAQEFDFGGIQKEFFATGGVDPKTLAPDLPSKDDILAIYEKSLGALDENQIKAFTDSLSRGTELQEAANIVLADELVRKAKLEEILATEIDLTTESQKILTAFNAFKQAELDDATASLAAKELTTQIAAELAEKQVLEGEKIDELVTSIANRIIAETDNFIKINDESVALLSQTGLLADLSEVTEIEISEVTRQNEILAKINAEMENKLFPVITFLIFKMARTIDLITLTNRGFIELINAIRSLTSKINKTRPVFIKDEEGNLIDFKLKGPFNIAGLEALVATLLAGIETAPALQAGGIVRKPLTALIGERGPEAVIPLDQLGGIGGNITNEITINVDGVADDTTAEDIAEKVAVIVTDQIKGTSRLRR